MRNRFKMQFIQTLAFIILMSSGTALAGPELTADWKDISVNGSEINLTILATNSGDEDAGQVWFELFVRQGEAQEGETAVDTETKDPFPVGDYEFSMKTGPLTPGTYTLELRIDTLETNTESNEDDNVISTQVTIAAAPKGYIDLEAVELTAAITDSNVLFTGTVTNNGTAPAENVRLDVFCGSGEPPAAGSHGYPQALIESLQPDEVRDVEFQLTNYLAGDTPCFLVADSVGSVAEVDESNNTFGPFVLSVPAFDLTPLADIVVLSVEPIIISDTTIDYKATFYNAGSEPLQNLRAQIFWNSPEAPEFGLVSGDKNFDFIVNDTFNQVLLPGDTRTVTWTWSEVPPTGLLNAWVYADTNNVFAEANENNNRYGPVVVDKLPPVGTADLFIDSVETSLDGYNVTYIVTIGNQGDATPGSFDVDIFSDAETEPLVTDGAAAAAYTSLASGPAPGQTIDVEVEWNSDVPGDFSSWVVVDAYQQVTESNETNNGFGPIAISIEEAKKPELTITSFEGEAVAGNGNFTVTVENTGPEPAESFVVSLYSGAFEGGEPTGDDDAEDTVQVSGLAPGDSESLSLTWENVPAGSNPAFVIVDPSNEIDEANEQNNVEGPVVIFIDEANCPDDTFLSAQCICGTTPQQTGYCCDGSWSALPCGINEVEDEEEVEEEDASASSDDEENGAETPEGEDIVAPDSGSGGCTNAATPGGALFGMLLLLFALARQRKTFAR